ncbi:delta-60 repeat domain-containing protein [Deinococcus sp. ME38]|uniref:delta-60 repeat domain-containing protein n=1 Tax=Deinococcus sp. ME38 TaxID=3400344 RepID=UPI003B5C3C28
MRRVTLALLPLLLGGCQRAAEPPAPAPPSLIGYVEVTAGEQPAARWVDQTLTPLTLTELPAGLDLRAVTAPTPTLDDGATRYLFSTVQVRNGRGADNAPERRNITFLAVDTDGTIADTAIRSVRSDTGTLLNTPDVARAVLPAHRMDAPGDVTAAGADFVAYPEPDLPALTGMTGTLLPWGFAARRCLNAACDVFDRTLPANPAPTRYDGRVTFAFKTPRGADAASTPRSVTAVYAVFEDAARPPRITQTTEEQAAGTTAGLGSVPAGFDLIRFPGSALNTGTLLGAVRTSGGAGAPTAQLFTPLDPCAGPAGSLDPCFGTGGKVTTDFAGSTDDGRALSLDAQGRILVAGYADTGTQGYDFALARYTASGALDATFGTGGKVITDFAGSGDVGFALSLDAQGRILVAGSTYTGTQGWNFALARYTASGTLDPTFGTGGKVTTDFAGSLDFGFALSLDAQGRILVAGYTYTGTQGNNFALARYTASGALDPAFGTGGKVTTDFAGSNDGGFALSLDAQGRILVAGYADTGTQGNNFALARYTTSGALDATFGTGGKVITDFAGSSDLGFALSLDAQGRILVAGRANTGTQSDNFALARYTTNGALDPTFGTGGKVATDFAGSSDEGRALSLDAQGRILVAGYTYTGTQSYNFALARYTASGALDATFGTGGKVTTDFTGSDDVSFALSLDAQGRILVAGYAYTGTQGSNFALMRVLP